MTISKEKKDDKFLITLDGRLDTVTAPQFEDVITNELENISQLVLDFEKLEYISSAGLRVILSAQKIMNRQGKMKIINVNKNVMEVFEITGFLDILDIE